MGRDLLMVLSFSLLTLPARAQVNTEKMRAFDVEGFATTIGSELTLESGNSDLVELGVSARFDYRRGTHYTFLASEVEYGTEDDKTFKNRAFAHLRYNYQMAPWLVGEAFTQLQRDGFKLLQLRALAGGGPRIRYFQTGTVGLYQGSTLMYEHENLEADELITHPPTTSVVRWSNYLNLRVTLTEKTSFINTVYVQPRLGAFEDVRVLNEAALAVALTRHLTLATTFNLYYDSRPPQTVDDLDLALENGLQIHF